MTTVNTEAQGGLRQPGCRAISLLLAVPLSLLLMIHPALMLDSHGQYSHGMLSLAMWGIAGGFIHGVGFDPRTRVWQWLFHPWLAWLLMALGYQLLAHSLGVFG